MKHRATGLLTASHWACGVVFSLVENTREQLRAGREGNVELQSLQRSLAEGGAKGQQLFGSPSTSSNSPCFDPDFCNFQQVQIHQNRFILAIIKRLIHSHCTSSQHGGEALSYGELHSTSRGVITFQGQGSSFPPMQSSCQQEEPGFICVHFRDCGRRLTHVGFTRCLSVEWAALKSKRVLQSMPNQRNESYTCTLAFLSRTRCPVEVEGSFLAWRISHQHRQNIRGMEKRQYIDFAL